MALHQHSQAPAADMALRQDIEDWLAQAPALPRCIARINAPSPRQQASPALIVAVAATSDWSGKGFCGREVELTLTLTMRGAEQAEFAALLGAVEARMDDMPGVFSAGQLVTLNMLTRRFALTADGVWRARCNYRARIIVSQTH